MTVNTIASFEAFLASYGGSDYASTAQRLLQRARSRSAFALASVGPPCACSLPVAPRENKKAKPTKKEKQATRSTKEKPTKRGKRFVSDDEVRDSPPRPARGGGGVVSGAPPVSIGIGIGGMGIGRRGGGGGSIGRHPGSTQGPAVRGHR